MLLIFPSGTNLCFKNVCGINFWGVHGHDGIWHLAIANVSFHQFPFIAPTFAGQNLYGYNYAFDFIVFILSKIGIDPLISYFKLLPVIWFGFFTLLLVRLAKTFDKSRLFVGLFLFFNYFAGSFSYIISLKHHGTINGSSTILPQPAMHMMSNLPYAFSLLFFIPLLIMMRKHKVDAKSCVYYGLCIFAIMGLKFYGGVISIFMVMLYFCIKLIRHDFKKLVINSLIIGLFVIAGVFFFYDPFTSLKTGSIFGFAPFALIHPITEEPGNFYMRSLTDARYYLMAHGGIGPRLIAIETLNMFLFLFFYLGTRFFAFLYIPYLFFRKKLNQFDVTILLTTIFAITLTSLLVQKAEWWNTIQFFFYAIFLLTIFLTNLSFELIKKKNIFLSVLFFAIIVLSIPTSYDLLRLFSTTPGATYIPTHEIEALQFLKKQPFGVVLTPIYNKKWKVTDVSNPLYAYEDTAYVSAMSGKQSYYANLLQLRLTGVPYEARLKKLMDKDCSVTNEVDYIYELRELPDNEKIMIYCKPKHFKQIFENQHTRVYSKIK